MHRFTWPRRRKLAGAALACVIALGAGGTAIAEFIDPYSPPYEGKNRHYFKLAAKHSGLYLNVSGASTKNGAEIGQWKSDGAMNEQWEWVDNHSSNARMIRNRWSRQCITADSYTEGAVMVQRPCEGTANQRWTFNKYGEWHGAFGLGTYTNLASGYDLNIAGGSGLMGAKLIQYRHVYAAPNALFQVTGSQNVVD